MVTHRCCQVFEVSPAKQKLIRDILTWTGCSARYMSALAERFPNCVPGLMSHLLTVLRADAKFEDPAWRVYNESFREKMAAKGKR